MVSKTENLMNIAHIAIWTHDIEAMKDFYVRYFNGTSNEKYINPATQFESYFISFENGAKLELMHKPCIDTPPAPGLRTGLAHIAFAAESRDFLISLTETLRSDGFQIVGEPRITGDGYFESVVLDVEGNRVELVAESK
jgi:putative acetyltransferase